MPFDLMTNLTVEQPVFAANFIKGTIQAAPYGGWEGQATFKLVFRNGGAIEFAQLMVKAASSALWEAEAGGLPEFRSLSPAQATWRNPISTENAKVNPAWSFIAYGVPPAGYGPHLPDTGAPPAGYGAQPAGNEGPPVGHRASPAGYGAPPRGYEAPPAGNEGLPAGYRASPAGSGARPHESAAAEAPENEASLPSASSS
uniref:Uncharacterized protein n=1 Tax=Colobus angolensis palliatus TaxID=336983 RepID=A0A2K5IMM9_COLAP